MFTKMFLPQSTQIESVYHNLVIYSIHEVIANELVMYLLKKLLMLITIYVFFLYLKIN